MIVCYDKRRKKIGKVLVGWLMKVLRYALLLGATLAPFTIKTQQEEFRVVLEAKWKDLENNAQKRKQFGSKWILAGSIVFKKRSSDIIFLDEIQLTWKGKKINNLIASLYEKNDTGSFLPIEKYHLCDSMWKLSTQQLFLKFNRPFALGAVNTFYLVLTVPEEIETKLKCGHFCITQHGLPFPYRKYVGSHNLSLALNSLPTISTAM